MIFRIIIPARYGSTRLPGKLLLPIGDKSIIQHVYEKAQQSSATSVVIATDDERIAEVCQEFGGEYCMTDVTHPSGTDRIAEAVELLGYDDDDIIVNVQGDEPLIPSASIHQVAKNLKLHSEADITTLYQPIEDITEVMNPNVVKVVFDQQGFALYFSRAPIPWEQENFAISTKDNLQYSHFIHIGLYAYRVSFIKKYIKMAKAQIELAESLEQLRALYYGARIHVDRAESMVRSEVNTQEDLIRVRASMEA